MTVEFVLLLLLAIVFLCFGIASMRDYRVSGQKKYLKRGKILLILAALSLAPFVVLIGALIWYYI